MEGLVLGTAKLVVEGAVTKAQSAIEEESRLRKSAKQDLAFISSEFEMVQCFLSVATMERMENKVVLTWVRQVRELAYDVEDCIDFFMHLDTSTSWWWRVIPSWCIAPPPMALALDKAVGEIKLLKARVENVSARNSRHNLIGDSGSKPLLHLQREAAAPPSMGFNVLVEARRRQGLGNLTRLITNKDCTEDHPLQVISVWGTCSDLGTTSIVREAYNDPEVSEKFVCRSWVKLMHPFDPRDFVRRFMTQVYTNTCKEQGARVGVHVLKKMEASQEDLLEEFVDEVSSKTYLVVLENLTDMVDWDAVRTFLPDMKKGSCIIVPTQHLEIAGLCIGTSYQQLELKQFSHEHSVCAFFKEGSQDYGKTLMEYYSYGKTPSNREAATYWLENHPLLGRETEMNELRNYIAKACFCDSGVIFVCGVAGIGKSDLVRNIFYDRTLRSGRFNKYIWVDISHPFHLSDFSRSLISDHRSQKDPIEECRELLRQRRCLVVIDDLQSRDDWEIIRGNFVSRYSSSVIIVITSNASIATYCAKNGDQLFNVKGLEVDAAMDLFRKEVKRKNPSCPLLTQKYAELEEIILKCGGLPKVIVSIAALVATQTVTFMDNVRSLNDKFMQHLENNPDCDNLRGLFDWMYNYFRFCPESLEPYIFYISIFPQGQNIRRRRLVRRWIAEGYSRDSEEESAVDKGENFFSKLLDLSIIQKIPQLVTTAFNDTRMVACQVNGFIREYIVSRRMEQNLVFELGPSSVLTTQRTGRHLIILDTWHRDKIVFESIDFSRLRSMTLFGKWEPFFISKSIDMLRVLDLEDAWGVKDEDLRKIVKQMLRLKFLSLRGQGQISRLPNSLGDLWQLQTLDVRHTSIVKLPSSIGKLRKLQYIRAGSKASASTPVASSNRLPQFLKGPGIVGVKVPRAIGKLTALHTLGVINVGASGWKAIVEELKKLTQLRKLGVSGINKHNSKEFLFATSGHVHLESLLVQLDEDSQGCLDDISLPWNNLQSVKLYGLEDKLPLSASHLNKLRKLDLEMETLKKNGIEFLAKLPVLCILRLRVKKLEDDKLHFYAEMVGCELLTFEKVKILEIACSSSKVSQVVFGSKSMKNLELLKVDCSSASYQLIGLNYLSELKQVLLKGADEEIKTSLEELLANHPGTPPAVKLEELPRQY